MWLKENSILILSHVGRDSLDAETVIASHMNAREEKSDDAVIYYVLATNSRIMTLTDGEEVFSCSLQPGDLLAFREPFKIQGDEVAVLSIPDIKTRGFGKGPKRFLVTATINDRYTLPVWAETKEEAIALSHDVKTSLWDHPDIEPHLTQRVIVRMARWGNLEVEEIV
tara:strand:- start:2055 stop:2558 length:504 start_codon:yes stop_codon:yes gene_type:complete